MAEPFLAEIKQVGFNFAPRGFAQCDGQILPINQNQSLYSLLGTTYGGNGRTDFALPDLRGRAAMHRGSANPLGLKRGEETVALNVNQVPAHNHALVGTTNRATSRIPDGTMLAVQQRGAGYLNTTPDKQMDLRSVADAGANRGHDNMQPFLPINFVIALQGLFPSRN